MMKRVALVNPGRSSKFVAYEPLNIGYLAAFLLSHNFDVKIFDEVAGDDIEMGLSVYQPDIVGVTATTPLAPRAYDILAHAKKNGFTTVIGGPHAAALPEESINHADYVVIGEGENVLLKILKSEVDCRIIKGNYIENIDTLPPPARHLMWQNYYADKKNHMPVEDIYFLSYGKRLATMITSRGCPYRCIYCHNSLKTIPVRYNSYQRVVEEILYLKEHYAIDAIFFMDDDFFINKSRLRSICEKLISNHIKIEWSANSRVDSIDIETLNIAKKAGLRQINFGIESGSQRILNFMGKKMRISQAKDAINVAKEAGLFVYATIMIGNPTETERDIELTREFVYKNKIDSLGVCITTPYPGTKLWDWCHQNNLIPMDYSWEDFTMEKSSIVANKIYTREEIEKIKNQLVIRFIWKNKNRFILFYLKGLIKHPILTIMKMENIIRKSLLNRRYAKMTK